MADDLRTQRELDAELAGALDDGTCGDCADGKCHGTSPDECGCARHAASVQTDEDGCCCNGCVGMGPCDQDLARTPDEDGCCALVEGEGHDGPCVWVCSDCSGDGKCPACGGDGEDGSGLPDTCLECSGSGACPSGCDDGMQTDDVYPLGRPTVTVHLPDGDVT